MTDASRQCIIAGNWKMYKTIDEALQFIDAILPISKSVDCQIILAVPFTAIESLSKKVKKSKIAICAQNMNDASEGAFTGEVSADMLKDAGASYVLLGHSERRKIFGETDDFINRKVKRALESGLNPILCIGETFEEHEKDETEAVLERQLRECLAGIQSIPSSQQLILAYEPVWSIGTGKAASPEHAEKIHKLLRDSIHNLLGEEISQKMPILYGGSVKPENAPSFLSEEDIDGLLVGSASLNPDAFSQIIQLRKMEPK